MTASSEVSLWLLALPARLPASTRVAFEGVLDDDERVRAARFLHPGGRDSFLAAHALLRTMLSAAAGVAPAAWQFACGPHGKPRAVDPTAPHFSLTHTDGLAACAILRTGPVGVDAENVTYPVRLADYAAVLSADERERLAALPDGERGRAFFDVWTAKEAWVKATGLGLSQPLGQVTVRDAADRPALAGDEPAIADWRLHRVPCGERHTLAVASPASAGVNGPTPRWWYADTLARRLAEARR